MDTTRSKGRNKVALGNDTDENFTVIEMSDVNEYSSRSEMFSKRRQQRTSMKHNANNGSSATLTRERSPFHTSPVTTNVSTPNFLFIPVTIQNSTNQPTNTNTSKTTNLNGNSQSSNVDNGSVRRRLFNLLRFTASRPTTAAAAVRFSRQKPSSIDTSSSCHPSQPSTIKTSTTPPPLHCSTISSSSSSVSNSDHLQQKTTRTTSIHVLPTLETADNVNTTNEHVNIIQRTSVKLHSNSTSANNNNSVDNELTHTCALCCYDYPSDQFDKLTLCVHSYCKNCLKSYLKLEITEGRVNLNCPQADCTEKIHPCDISRILSKSPELIRKYEEFMVRKVLQAIPDTRWCPSPDCGFAAIASGYAACPEIQCLRPGCNTSFCYHCKQLWHPNQTCEDAAREKSTSNKLRSGSFISIISAQQRDEIKPCPRCQASILKMDDGSCNHMTCPMCECEFCWLCMKEISDLHYLSPSGCTFWGKKQWSRKKVILWQLATLIGAPVGIALIAGVAVPAILIGVPIWTGRRVFKKFNKSGNNKLKRNLLVTLGILGSIVAAPIIAGLAVGIGVPILLAYVYGVIPISLCRTGGCAGNRNDLFDNNESSNDNILPFNSRDAAIARGILNDTQSVLTHPTIGDGSLAMTNSLSNSVNHLVDDRKSKALTVTAGTSICESLPTSNRLEVQAEMNDCKSYDIESITISEKSSKTMDSLKALAGSIKDACAVPGEYGDCCIYDSNTRKSSLLSSASDYARSIISEQQHPSHSACPTANLTATITVNTNRAGSPIQSEKSVSFSDESIRLKSKRQLSQIVHESSLLPSMETSSASVIETVASTMNNNNTTPSVLPVTSLSMTSSNSLAVSPSASSTISSTFVTSCLPFFPLKQYNFAVSSLKNGEIHND